MLSREVIMNFIHWLLGTPQPPEALLIPIDEEERKEARRRPPH